MKNQESIASGVDPLLDFLAENLQRARRREVEIKAVYTATGLSLPDNFSLAGLIQTLQEVEAQVSTELTT